LNVKGNQNRDEAPVVFSKVYCCNRNGFVKKKDDAKRIRKLHVKLGQKGCPCKLVVKKRLNSEVYEMEYHHLHSHSTGLDNIKYTKISKDVKEFAKTLFSEGYTFDRVRHGIDESDEFKLRDQVMDDRSLKSIQQQISKMKWALNKEDFPSLRIWVEKLREAGNFFYFNPDNDGKFEIAFTSALGKLKIDECHKVVCMDSTHNTTLYEGYQLFSLITQNKFGKGVPVAFMITNDRTSKPLKSFLIKFKELCPTVGVFITDNDSSEIEAITEVFPRPF